MSNLHVNLDEANKHTPKGFDNVGNNTRPWKDEQSASTYTENFQLPRAINFVDGTLAAPSNGDGDIFVLTGSGTLHADWGTAAAFQDWVRFTNTIATPITPLAGALCYDDTASSWMEFDGSVWAAFGGGGTDTNLGTDNLTNTAVLRTYNINGNELKFNDGINSVLKIMPSGVGFGNVSTPTAMAHIKGSGTTSGTTALLVQNSAGTDLLEVKDDGNIGVGINPIVILDVNSTKTSDNIRLLKSGAAQSILGYGTSGGYLQVLNPTGTVTRFLVGLGANDYIDTGSNLGIGITTPSAKLHIEGANELGTSSAILVTDGAVSPNDLLEIKNDGTTLFGGGDIGVGISPAVILDVNSTKTSDALRLLKSSAAQALMAYGTSGGYLQLLNPTGATTRFLVGLGANDYIDTGSNLGIGITAPTAKVHVVGSTLLDGNLGVFGTTPIAQPTTGIAPSIVAPGVGTNVLQDDTFDGYTVAQVVKALRNLGILT